MKKQIVAFLGIILLLASCADKKNDANVKQEPTTVKIPFDWNAANLYFLLTDRFNNGDTTNDVNFSRTEKTGKYRGFEGGDLKGITQKIREGYFTKLGVNAIWMTPIVEQIKGGTDEGNGFTYAYHGYWTKDWTQLDPNFGTIADLKELIKVAHENDIRVLLDAVVNHTGPVTEKDEVWENTWVRTSPQCMYKDYESTIRCTLVKNLPDVLTEKNTDVELPKQLVEKWKSEGRYEQEVAELDEFFKKTGYPRAPRFYIMKWLADYIAEFGIDGYRVDTVKHTEENVWQEFRKICDEAYNQFKQKHPKQYLSENFYLVGEVYGYGIGGKQLYDFGDKKVNYFDKAFNSLINFEFKWNAKQVPNYEATFSRYDSILHTDLKGYGVLNYLSSHDDGEPFDAQRAKPYEMATKLLLTPGTAQIYYGDETARPLEIDGAEGDANLRSPMNWEDVAKEETKKILAHWQKLGKFRKKHPSVGAGKHTMLSETPYIFKREYSKENYQDKVIVGLDLPVGNKTIQVAETFNNSEELYDAYSNQKIKVIDGNVSFSSPFTIVLLEKYK
ncbi:alpha-amylase family glycosyl hydrolase [Tenacibaculum tangerinum]|uniref:Alpha-amylase family glycosyl hydrolase n=1 Tax=Tenacibaculum tangerinum TaxID=3038772 RepID=A0ABY8L3F4_9FLAO|nr:alpha-amylase family glycosyl hydrolase [Tenacibaculum tangerinum]WGH75968.1 alpha-amylase family glycosyl hydrolase [Tenacibaculum tangerinum]